MLIASHRKILCALALAAATSFAASAVLAVVSSASAARAEAPAAMAGARTGSGVKSTALAAAGGVLLRSARLAQAGRKLVMSVRTSRPVALARLQPHPDPRRAAARYLCFEFRPRASAPSSRYCLGSRKPHRRIGWEQEDRAGRPLPKGTIAATVRRPDPDKLVVALVPRAAGLSPRHYRWRAVASQGCGPVGRCRQALPPRGFLTFRLRPVRAIGCTGGGAGLVTNGPRDRDVVALTFDDGPSEYTPEFLRVLREKAVPATFFEIGQEMPGREGVMRRILAEGDEIGDHTMNHVEYPGYSQIAAAASRIAAYTHFRPCLFRPPGGGVDPNVIATAGSLGMRTVTWDVDPRDWSTPGTEAIYSNIVDNARPGSIILMHDGGGPRDETLAALPRVIDTLRSRGYRFETVSALLGGRILYRPYG